MILILQIFASVIVIVRTHHVAATKKEKFLRGLTSTDMQHQSLTIAVLVTKSKKVVDKN